MLINGLKFFLAQTLLEVIVIIVLLYAGVPYFEMYVGKTDFITIVIGVFGFYAFTKCIYYGWIYLLAFAVFGLIKKGAGLSALSYLNCFLSVFYIFIFILKGRPASWLLNPFVAALVSSAIIILFLQIKRRI